MLSLSFSHLFHIFSPIWLSRAAVAGALRGADPTLLNLLLTESFRPDRTGFLRYKITLFHKFQLFFFQTGLSNQTHQVKMDARAPDN